MFWQPLRLVNRNGRETAVQLGAMPILYSDWLKCRCAPAVAVYTSEDAGQLMHSLNITACDLLRAACYSDAHHLTQEASVVSNINGTLGHTASRPLPLRAFKSGRYPHELARNGTEESIR